MLKKIASNYLEKVSFLGLFEDDGEDELDKVMHEMAVEVPKHALKMKDGTFVYDTHIYDADTDKYTELDKQTLKELKGYNHKDLIKRINKVLPKLLKEYREDGWEIPEHIKTLKLKGVGRSLHQDKDKTTPFEYFYHIGSPEDRNFSLNEVLDHGISAYADTPEDIMLNG